MGLQRNQGFGQMKCDSVLRLVESEELISAAAVWRTSPRSGGAGGWVQNGD